MVINGDSCDKHSLVIGDLVIQHCEMYVYLGLIFTPTGSLHITLVEHTEELNKQSNKLPMFMSNNKDMPFVVKRLVVGAAFNASILYGCIYGVFPLC